MVTKSTAAATSALRSQNSQTSVISHWHFHMCLDLADGGHKIARRQISAQHNPVADNDCADIGIFVGNFNPGCDLRRVLVWMDSIQMPWITFIPWSLAIAAT